jgi:benzoyl-CoA-dihydrodiol lyase
LVDEIATPAKFRELVGAHAQALAERSSRPADAKGIRLNPLRRTIHEDGYHYRHVDVTFDRAARTATITVSGPEGDQPLTVDEIHTAGEQWWPLSMARELDDAILMLRVNELDLGLWLLKTSGRPEAVLASDRVMLQHSGDWLVRETVGLLRRTFARLEVCSRSMYAIIEPGSCFAGVLFELALAADRSYMLSLPETDTSPKIGVNGFNFGLLPTVNGRSRLGTRFSDDAEKLKAVQSLSGHAIGPQPAVELSLVTLAPDDLDWEEEVRIAIEERAALSPDALTGMEASLRFPGDETIATKLFGRLSAWQNWVFIRPNSTGEHGALKLFGTGAKARFTWERV